MVRIKSYFGIDFGTTNSAIVSIVEGVKKSKYGDNSGNPFPSLVMIDRITGETICGRLAWERRRELSETCEVIHSVKDYLGTEKVWNIAGKQWTPEMVAAQILMGLKQQVSITSGKTLELDEAVISVPVGFSSKKRRALRNAADIARIKVKSFISESTAALFKHYHEVKKYSKIAVFDWGGGTLDVSVIENTKGEINELAVSGLRLGGDDIDLKIAKWAHAKLVEKENLNLSFEDMESRFQDIMLVKAEIAKKNLSEMDSTSIAINKYGDLEFVRVPFDVDIFSELIEQETNRAIATLEETVSMAGLNLAEIECVMMVGGSSNLRPLLEKIEERWSDLNIEYPEDSEWDVAEGAAQLCMTPGSFRLNQDVCVILSDGSIFPIIKRDSSAPMIEGAGFTFGIVEDTKDARFIFTDNTRSLHNDNIKILDYISVPTYGFYKEQLEMEAKINEDLVLNVTIKSDRKPQQYEKRWSYSKLRFYYDLNSGMR